MGAILEMFDQLNKRYFLIIFIKKNNVDEMLISFYDE